MSEWLQIVDFCVFPYLKKMFYPMLNMLDDPYKARPHIVKKIVRLKIVSVGTE